MSVCVLQQWPLWCFSGAFTTDEHVFIVLCVVYVRVQIGRARFRAPELLFQPHLIGEECEGIQEVLAYSVQKSDMDLRKTFYSNIILSGGSTLFKGKP